MTFDEWAQIGVAKGWCGPPVCSTHDGIPTSAGEDEVFDDGDDPCVHIIRLYEDDYVRHSVEKNHSPSVWRKLFGETKPWG